MVEKLKEVLIETPIAKTKGYVIDENEYAFVPILRAGMGMIDGVLTLMPNAKIGHIGMYRNEETLEPVEYYFKLPVVENPLVVVVDPMLATGGSASAAITMLKKRGCKDIRYIGLVGAPEGVATLQKDHPDVDIYLASLDEKLNENGYIVPGLGDCGDRLFGTK